MDLYLPARLLPLPSLLLSDIPGCSVTPLGPAGGCDPAGCQTVVPRVVVGAASLMLSDVRRMKSAVRCVSSFPSPGRLQAVGCRAGVGPGLCQLRGLRTEMTRASLEAAEPTCVLAELLTLGEGEESVTPRFLGRAGRRQAGIVSGRQEALAGWTPRAPLVSGDSGSSRLCPTLGGALWPLTLRLLAGPPAPRLLSSVTPWGT